MSENAFRDQVYHELHDVVAKHVRAVMDKDHDSIAKDRCRDIISAELAIVVQTMYFVGIKEEDAVRNLKMFWKLFDEEHREEVGQ